jgi:hypothetical protein
VSKQHPSGRPKRTAKFGTTSRIRWPLEGFVCPRLSNNRSLEGGFGFRLPANDSSHLHHVALASRDSKDRR